jgi:hypothetical protein
MYRCEDLAFSMFSTFTGALVSVASRFDSEYIAMIDSRYRGTAGYLGFFLLFSTSSGKVNEQRHRNESRDHLELNSIETRSARHP